METIFRNTENSKTNEPHKFVLNLSQNLDLRSSNKHAILQNLSISYTWKNIRQHYKTHGMISLNFLTVLIQCQMFKTILSIS